MNTTTEKCVGIRLSGPRTTQKDICNIIFDALHQRGAEVASMIAGEARFGPAKLAQTKDTLLVGLSVVILPDAATIAAHTVADRYSDPVSDADLAEAVRTACRRLNDAIKAARDSGLAVEVAGSNRLRQVQIIAVTRPL